MPGASRGGSGATTASGSGRASARAVGVTRRWGCLWPFAVMHRREVLAGGGGTLSDTMHVVLGAITVWPMFVAIAYGAAAFGRRFRLGRREATFAALRGAGLRGDREIIPTARCTTPARVTNAATSAGVVRALRRDMTRTFRIAAALTSIVLAGCAPIAVGTYAARYGAFTTYRTFTWAPADRLPVGDPRLDANPIVEDHLKGAVEKVLMRKGYELPRGGAADLRLHYHVAVSERVDATAGAHGAAECPPADCSPRVMRANVVTFVIDVVDRQTLTLVWRGWAQTDADVVLGDQSRLEYIIDKAMANMIGRFPPAHPGIRVR
jgi:hypothetical protein